MIEIIRQSDELNREVWEFWPEIKNKVDIILNRYEIQSRLTKRHGWKTTEEYDRLDRKGWSHKGHRLIDLSEVPVFPSDVVEEVMIEFMTTVTVRRSSR
jgi:hypothetical protein